MIVRAKRLFSSKQALPPIQEAPIDARQEAPSPARQEAPAPIVAHNDAEIAPRQEAFEGLLKKAKGAKEAKVQERLAQEPMEPLTPEEERIAQMEEKIREMESKAFNDQTGQMTSTLADWKAKVAEKMMAPKSMDCVSIEDEPESARQMEKEEAETLAMESSASAPSKPAAEEPKMPSSKDQAKTYMRRRIRFPK